MDGCTACTAVLCDSSPFYSDSSPVFFTLTRTRTQTQKSWLVTSGPSHAWVQAVAAVPCCAVYSDIQYILLCVFMFWKINKCWICGLLDSWLGLEIFFLTRTRTLRWWLGLGLGFDNLDSDTALLHSNQFCKNMSKLVLSKLALFVLHDGICGSFHNKATINASALLCVLWQNLDEESFDMLYKNDCWAAIPDPIWTTNVPYERGENAIIHW